jgi:predicted outer membrane lipoprotein
VDHDQSAVLLDHDPAPGDLYRPSGRRQLDLAEPRTPGSALVSRTHRRVPRGAGGIRSDVLAARAAQAPQALPAVRRPRRGRTPALGLTVALGLGLSATFFGWASADPFWLGLGAGDRGTVTVTGCTGGAFAGDCVGRFSTADADAGAGRPDGTRAADVRAADVRISSLPVALRMPGERVPARRLHGDAGWAYAGSAVGLHLRWVLGLLLALACGIGTAMLTGVRELRRDNPGQTRTLWLLAVGGPLALFAGAVAADLLH